MANKNRNAKNPAPTSAQPKGVSRRKVLIGGGLAALGLGLGWGLWPQEATGAPVRVYKSPTCDCCADWVSHMRSNGFPVTVVMQEDVTPMKEGLGVPDSLWSCHTAIIDDGVSRYVLEGHVPAADVTRLMAERPKAIGLAVPGMPIGSPGMEQGSDRDPYQVVLFSKSARSVYASY